MGTPCFMSPEQLRSTRDVDARADIWSMGAILHALLTGAPPYDGESNADVSAKIIRDLPTPIRQLRPEVPAELEAIVLRCLEKDPATRYPDVAELAKALAAVTVRDSVKSSAARVVRGSLAHAPTVHSTPPPPIVAASGPTRTASAWGETGRSGKVDATRGTRKLAGVVAAVALAAVLGTLGLVRWRSAAPALSAPPSPATAALTDPSIVPQAAPPPLASAAASNTPSPPTPPSPPTSSSASLARPAGPPALRRPGAPPAAVKSDPALVSVATVAPPPPAAPSTAPAPTKPASGLFDGRE
jgi:serine/threonine-protein kinase